MASAFPPPQLATPKEREQDEQILQERGWWPRLPWLTPVLGSGCLSEPVSDDAGAAALAKRVGAEIARLAGDSGEHDEGLPPDAEGLLPDGPAQNWATIAEGYTATLARERLTVEIDSKTTEPDKFGCRLILIAALLTRFCHAARAISPSAISRLPDEVVVYDPSGDDPYGLAEAVLPPLLAMIDTVCDELEARQRSGESRQVDAAILSLFQSITLGLRSRQPTIGLNAARLATEAAWYMLLGQGGRYHGWSEVLVGLILREGLGDTLTAHKPKRPRFRDLHNIPALVSELFEEPTRHSWNSPRADSVHAAVAAMLSAQARAPRGEQPPPSATAFSTSFDLELEMALWRSGQPFSIALPVHLMDDYGVDLCWLIGHVDPDLTLRGDAALRALRTPREWGLFARDDALRPGRPVVVRLTGAPLISLEHLRSDQSCRDTVSKQLRETGFHLLPSHAVHPAVTVDEYLALRHAEVEIFWSAQRKAEDAAHPTGRGLNRHVMADGTGPDGSPRYWVVLGVPFGDRAVRQRFMSPLSTLSIVASGDTKGPTDAEPKTEEQLAALGAIDGFATTPPAPPPVATVPGAVTTSPPRRGLTGLAVNTRFDEDEAFLLTWLGLSVVRAACREFVPDINDYTEHLLSEDGQRRLARSGCELWNQ